MLRGRGPACICFPVQLTCSGGELSKDMAAHAAERSHRHTQGAMKPHLILIQRQLLGFGSVTKKHTHTFMDLLNVLITLEKKKISRPKLV